MGRDIDSSRFTAEDFHEFSRRLRAETLLLRDWLRNGAIEAGLPRIGYELEASLVDRQGWPAPRSTELLAQLREPALGHELAQFNMEFNGSPRDLAERPFSGMQEELSGLWRRCCKAAHGLGLEPLMVGTLPTARPEHLALEWMSPLHRYRALNEQVLRLRNSRPLRIDIEQGDEAIHLERPDVMLEAASTSLQLHLQLTTGNAARCFNAAMVMAAASVAVAANSPWLFGHALWQESRIPLVEQAVAADPCNVRRGIGSLCRVSFGSGYAQDALYSLFEENRQHYPVLLPMLSSEPPERLPHLSLHNSTIWRWNRPVVGFDAQGRCHLRLEHRVMASGPTVVDVVANATFFHGLVQASLRRDPPLETEIPFAAAERNFYRAARDGLGAEVEWLGGSRVPLRKLLLESLLPKARHGLEQQGLAAAEFQPWLDLMEARVRTGRTGAVWQRAWVNRHGRDMQGLVAAYLARQAGGTPVHEWAL